MTQRVPPVSPGVRCVCEGIHGIEGLVWGWYWLYQAAADRCVGVNDSTKCWPAGCPIHFPCPIVMIQRRIREQAKGEAQCGAGTPRGFAEDHRSRTGFWSCLKKPSCCHNPGRWQKIARCSPVMILVWQDANRTVPPGVGGHTMTGKAGLVPGKRLYVNSYHRLPRQRRSRCHGPSGRM